MTALIDNQQRLIIENSAINAALDNDIVACFDISQQLEKLTAQYQQAQKPTPENIYAALANTDLNYCKTLNLIPTKIALLKASENKRILSSQKPHINPGDEVHFILDGGFVIYLVINSAPQAIILQKGDRLHIPAGIEHWIQMSQDNYLMIASFHSEEFSSFHEKVIYTDRETKNIFKN